MIDTILVTSLAYFKDNYTIVQEAPPSPDIAPYFYFLLAVRPKVSTAKDPTKDSRLVKMLFDPHNERWAYLKMNNRVANWPRRYMFTKDDRKTLGMAMEAWAEKPTDGRN